MKNSYESPFSARYASKEMLELFSPDMKFKTWRKLWIALAESEQALGLPISTAQIDELKAHILKVNREIAEARARMQAEQAKRRTSEELKAQNKAN